jgi:RsiW-degrading membrane proteinase PrsW (M82 family)
MKDGAPHSDNRFRSRSDVFRWRFLVLNIVLPSLSAVILVYLLPRPDLPEDPYLRAMQLVSSGLPARAKTVLEPWLQERLDDVMAHRGFISTHFSIPEGSGGSNDRDDLGLELFYETLRAETDGLTRDVATYALGFFWFQRNDADRALGFYREVEAHDLPYLNQSIGDALARLNRHDLAVMAFGRELELESSDGQSIENKIRAVHGMSESFLALRHWDALGTLIADPHLGGLASGNSRRAYYLNRGLVGDYLRFFVRGYVGGFTWTHGLLALFGSLIWLLVIRWWDVFEKEPLPMCVLSIVLGALVAHGVFILHDVLSSWQHIGLNGNLINDLLYCIFAIGLVEELVKIFPVFLVLVLTRHIDEPADWFVYGGLSALGFSTLENYFYLSELGSQVAVGRTFVSTPLHIALTGMLALSIPEARQRGWNLFLTFGASLIVVSIVHGIYDFFIMGPWVNLRPLSVLIALGWGLSFMAMIENIHTLSPFRERADSHQMDSTPWFLRAYLALVITVYLINSKSVSPNEATIRFFADLALNLLFVLMLLRYGRVRIEKNWRRMLV